MIYGAIIDFEKSKFQIRLHALAEGQSQQNRQGRHVRHRRQQGSRVEWGEGQGQEQVGEAGKYFQFLNYLKIVIFHPKYYLFFLIKLIF